MFYAEDKGGEVSGLHSLPHRKKFSLPRAQFQNKGTPLRFFLQIGEKLPVLFLPKMPHRGSSASCPNDIFIVRNRNRIELYKSAAKTLTKG